MKRSEITYRKILAILLALFVTVLMVYFVTYEASHMIHHCTGENCQICHELRIAESVTENITHTLGASISVILLAVFVKEIRTAVSGSASERNLILDKVRMDN